MLVTLSLPARSSWNGRSYLFIYPAVYRSSQLIIQYVSAYM